MPVCPEPYRVLYTDMNDSFVSIEQHLGPAPHGCTPVIEAAGDRSVRCGAECYAPGDVLLNDVSM